MTKPALADLAEFLTPQELADLCRVPLPTVYRWNYTGTGPAYKKLGKHARYSRAEVDRWLAEQAAGARRSA
jgi:excisionase family DNA binding protein